jgi:hypothetical protein
LVLAIVGIIPLVQLIGTKSVAANELEAHARARLSILANDLRGHVQLLADDSLEGREAGSRGGYTAGNYLVRNFQRHLEPAAAGSQYFQLFNGRYRNILGLLPGSDPKYKDQYVLVGAHYDHVGYGTRRNSNGPIGLIHNGADDNASGVAAVLELIDALGETELRPSRTILFALWDGEEQGLLGSQYWASQPTVPLSQIKLVINLDMVGRLRNRTLDVLGTRSMPGLRRLVAEANFADDLTLRFPWKLEENSDHHTFVMRQIPILMYHTGLHDDYHRPSDDVEGVDFEGLQAVTRLVFNSLLRLSDTQPLGSFRIAARYEGEARQRHFEQPLPAPSPRLGISWRPVGVDDPPGLEVLNVRPGSAAARAGLRPRDRLVSLNGQPLHSSTTLQQVSLLTSKLQLGVVPEGEDELQQRTVQLDGTPTRLGISWRYSAAEPHSVTLVRVIPHSPADQAGLRPGDRIHLLGANSFNDSQSFHTLTQQLQLPATVRIERAGRILELTLPALPNEWLVATPRTLTRSASERR